MSDDSLLSHRRHTIRLNGYDYRNRGAYFVTICTLNREGLFGDVVDGIMRLNTWGQIAEQEWIRSGEMRSAILLDEFVVMPNHVHGIIFIQHVGNGDTPPSARHPYVGHSQSRGRSQNAPTDGGACGARDLDEGHSRGRVFAEHPYGPGSEWDGRLRRPTSNSLGTIINGYKAAVTRQVRSLHGTDATSVWQRNYYEHIIRNDQDLERIRQYIRDNPVKWELDGENPDRSRS